MKALIGPAFFRKTLPILASLALLCSAIPAKAAFHLWTIQEIYSDSSGSLQFIELFDGPPTDSFGFQNSVNGMSITVQNVGNTQSHPFTVPGSSLSGNTFGHTLLFGTAGLQAAGGPAPDYIIPNGFLFTAGGSISFFGANSGSYTAMPTDGVNSRDWVSGGNAPNSPQNYAGQTGFVVVPEPTGASLLFCGGILWGLVRRKQA